MIRILATALAAIAFAGCAPIGVHWHKEGATVEDLNLAQKTCGEQSGDYNFALRTDGSTLNSDDSFSGQRFGSGSGGVYRECMERAGWRRVRGAPPPRAT